jgi:hypothetical protein
VKRPVYKHSKPQYLDKTVGKEELEELAQKSRYVGHNDHKTGKNPLVPHQWKVSPRPKASICPSNIRDAALVTGWLQIAIRRGAVSSQGKRVWYIGPEGIFEAINSNNHEYHGYPVTLDELPEGVREIYEKV